MDAKVNVRDGKFNANLEIPKRPEFSKGVYLIEVLFTPRAQTNSILSLVGNNGDRLKGDKAKDSGMGFKTIEASRKISQQVKMADYPMVKSTSYLLSQPEYAVAEFLSAWKKQDWARMVQFTQPSWRSREGSPTKTLESWFGIKKLLGATNNEQIWQWCFI